MTDSRWYVHEFKWEHSHEMAMVADIMYIFYFHIDISTISYVFDFVLYGIVLWR